MEWLKIVIINIRYQWTYCFIGLSFKTVCLSICIWVKEGTFSFIDENDIRADLPDHNKELYAKVKTLQVPKERKGSHLPVHEGQTAQDDEGCLIHYPQECRDIGLWGYICSVLKSLDCSIDVQVGDGTTLLLKYVCGYVSKLSSNINLSTLNKELNGWQ